MGVGDIEGAAFVAGNAADDERGGLRGWFVGHFITPADDLRRTQAVEIKWGVHAPDDEKPADAFNERGTTATILVSGRFVVEYPELGRSVTLARPGDYAITAPRVLHGWRALAESVVLTVRWPSVSGDQKQG